jgi:hypothetical protein
MKYRSRRTISLRLSALIFAMTASPACFSLEAITMDDLIRMADDPSKIRIVDVPEKVLANCETFGLKKGSVTGGSTLVCSAKTKTLLGGWDEYFCMGGKSTSAVDACIPPDALGKPAGSFDSPGAGFHWWWVKKPDNSKDIGIEKNMPRVGLMPTCVGFIRPLVGKAYFAETMDVHDFSVNTWGCLLGVERDSNGDLLGTSESNPRSAVAKAPFLWGANEKEQVEKQIKNFLFDIKNAGIRLSID